MFVYMETGVTCSGEERGGVVEGHEVARGGHGVAGPGEGGASGRGAGEPAALYRVSRALPATSMSSISSGHSIDIKMCDLWNPPGEGVRGDEGRPVELQHGVLRRGRGEGEHALGGPARSDREEESSNTVPVLYCTVLYCTVLYCLALRII